MPPRLKETRAEGRFLDLNDPLGVKDGHTSAEVDSVGSVSLILRASR